ncbi:murein hydrolase activator EnvC family protein [Ectobacillus funiculus]|uniref:murein hydrolase activator EnvC family protein n=1 Tax=Ectobacillus funiculus TaxID=137993 RepID=UPI0013EB8A77|nr:M23 family metallopeptidase [Ectobacillus funiculus]
MRRTKAIRMVLLISMIMGSAALPAYAETATEDGDPFLQHISNEHTDAPEQQQLEQLKQQLQQLDQEITNTQAELAATEQQTQETAESIILKKQSIETLEIKTQQRKEILKERLLALQSQPQEQLVTDALVQTNSMTDLLDSIYSLSLIFQSDENMLNEQQLDQKQLEQEKNSLEAKEAALQTYAASIKEKQQELEKNQAEKTAAIAALEQKLNETPTEMTNQEPLLTDSTTFIKPAAGAFTSGFGMRGNENHKGVDIASSGAVPIVAAAAGTVIRSYYSNSYGNVVFISHQKDGKTYTTVYAHMRSRSVEQGQVVQQGQQIGVMGNTGASQGQHLHFEIHEGDWNIDKSNAVDPMLFLH